MSLVFDASVRRRISRFLDLVKEDHPELSHLDLGLDAIDHLSDHVINQRQISARDDNFTHFSREISLAYLGIMSIGSLAITVEGSSIPALPLNWIHPSGRPNPNLALHGLLVAITNHALSTLRLVEAGLDSSARITLRVMIELCWLTVVLSVRQDKMIIYARDLDDKQEKKTYNEHLHHSKLIKELSEIERKLGLEEDLLQALRESRSRIYSFYSKTVHNSYVAIMMGAYAQPFDGDIFVSRAFGHPSQDALGTLNYLNETLFYVCGALPRIITEVHKLERSLTYEWTNALTLAHCFVSVFSSYHADWSTLT